MKMSKKIIINLNGTVNNLKRKVAGVPGLTEALFVARQSTLAEETKRLSETPLLYSCGHCGKEYRSSKAHTQHLKCKTHLARASQEPGHHDKNSIIFKPLPRQSSDKNEDISGSDESEWEEVDQEEETVDEANDSLRQLQLNGSSTRNGNMDEGSDVDEYIDELDPRCCFMCDLKHDTIESCTVHMHKMHGFFIPDVEYLKDPKGFLTYLGIKIKRDHVCLYCNDRCHPFSSLEAVRKHMEAKSHCKVHYGDGGDDEEVELEEFYDYSSRYRSMGLATVQSREHIVKMKVLKAMNRCGGGAMRSKIGMKSNDIRKLPKNIPY